MDDIDKYKDLLSHQSDNAEDELGDFLQKSSSAKLPSLRNKEAIWDKISEAIDEDEEKVGISRYKWIGIAASVILAVFIGVTALNNQSKEVTLMASNAENKIEELPDGSTVSINANSSISYSSDKNRELSLEGEAFFEVTEGDNFLVKTEFGTVRVLGTSFNVFARDESLEVSCKTGKVEVTIPSKNFKEIIRPGELVSFKEDTVRRTSRLPELMGKWQSGEFYFANRPIEEVFEEIQRQFNVEIEVEVDNLSNNQNFSGYFFTNKDVENALDMVCLPLGLAYEKTGQNLFAVSKTE